MVVAGDGMSVLLCRKPRYVIDAMGDAIRRSSCRIVAVRGPLRRSDVDRIIATIGPGRRYVYWCEYSADDLLSLASVIRGGTGRNALFPPSLEVISPRAQTLAKIPSDAFCRCVVHRLEGAQEVDARRWLQDAKPFLERYLSPEMLHMVWSGRELHTEALVHVHWFREAWAECVREAIAKAIV